MHPATFIIKYRTIKSFLWFQNFKSASIISDGIFNERFKSKKTLKRGSNKKKCKTRLLLAVMDAIVDLKSESEAHTRNGNL